MWGKDRDIALLDPAVYRGLEWAGLVLSRGEAGLSGTLLSAVGVDVPFTQTDIGEGDIVRIGSVLLEITSVLAGDTLEVSVLRARTDGALLPPAGVDTAAFSVLSFKPQLEWVHRQVLAMLGLKPPGSPAGDDRLGEECVVNTAEFARLETLGALHLIWAAAGALEANDHATNQRAAAYRRRFAEERQRATALIDTDGDGAPDVIRRPSVMHLTRA